MHISIYEFVSQQLIKRLIKYRWFFIFVVCVRDCERENLYAQQFAECEMQSQEDPFNLVVAQNAAKW